MRTAHDPLHRAAVDFLDRRFPAREETSDRRGSPSGLFVFFALVLAVPLGRTLFELTALPLYQYLLIAAGAAVWALLTRLIWRTKLTGPVLWRAFDGRPRLKRLGFPSAPFGGACGLELE